MRLTERQRTILNAVTERYIVTGTPVSSKELVGLAGLRVSSSTVRSEFAQLEEKGYLTHPHTSAGRMPTDLGYREFVDYLMNRSVPRLDPRTGGRPGALGSVLPEDLAGEIDTALRQATDAMSRATNLLALILAPRMSGARLVHVELLTLHPDQLMYVFIVSTGAVMKGVIDWAQGIDPGLVEWARTYLNETFADQTLTARLIRRVLENPELSPRESGFLRALAPAFEKLVDEQYQEELFVGGAARLLDESRLQDVSSLRDLLSLLEERFVLLHVLRAVLGTGAVVVRIGSEHETSALQPFSVVAASYGLPQRRLGTVSLVGPTRMDYETAIATVRETAMLLSEMVGERYE
ncbi:MAG: heat-inducible transcription repressor HrcA [Thermoleophilia bacterium]|nr:heat-inducible transcription repressor HrcA [Thermoleophilia bacterium]